VWNEKRSKWVLTITNEDTTFRDEADFVIFATGLLSNPLWPTNIPGRDDYKGKMVHSGDWKAAGIEDEEGFTWADKRVAIIGQVRTGYNKYPDDRARAGCRLFQHCRNRRSRSSTLGVANVNEPKTVTADSKCGSPAAGAPRFSPGCKGVTRLTETVSI